MILLIVALTGALIADRARSRALDAEQRLRLEAELRQRDAERIRLQEVQASRARVLAAADQERRRVVRDLHDGAQQRLVHTVVTLKLARRAHERGDGDLDDLLGEALGHSEAAIAELRELAHGILPSVLARGGLPAGLDALAARMPIPVTLTVDVPRLRGEVEAAAYFVAAEALTNVVKHAEASDGRGDRPARRRRHARAARAGRRPRRRARRRRHHRPRRPPLRPRRADRRRLRRPAAARCVRATDPGRGGRAGRGRIALPDARRPTRSPA